MQRKVCQVGPATLMVSLPSKWCRSNNVKKGDEIDVNEEGSRLILGGKSKKRKESVSLNAKGVPHVLYRAIGALYKAGYDEIELFYDAPEELSIIQHELGRTCVGFEMVEQTKNKVVIRSITTLEKEEFEVILRRCFLSVLSMADESLECATKLDKPGMEKVILSDDSVNRYSDFCRRIINKGLGIKGREPPVYFIAEQLEKVGDMYRDLMKHLLNHPIKLSKSSLKVYKEVNLFLRSFYEIYYNFDLERMDEFVIKRKEIQKLMGNAFEKSSKKEVMILFHLNNVFSTVFDLNGALLTARL